MKYLKRLCFIIILFGLLSSCAQTNDYYVKKGFVVEGYDVVAYFDDMAVEGKDTFIAIHDGAKFKFSNEANLKTFKNNPDKYVPQYGGYCAYAVATDSKKVKIDPETYEIRDGKLYLFYNAWFNNTLTSWQENDVKGLQQKADQNWEAMNFE